MVNLVNMYFMGALSLSFWFAALSQVDCLILVIYIYMFLEQFLPDLFSFEIQYLYLIYFCICHNSEPKA